MTTYSDVFGGANIYPSEISYSALSLTASVSLQWPLDTVTATTPVTRIMDVSANAAGYIITMPSATQVGTGETVLFNNTGSFTIVVKDAGGTQLLSIASGTAWQLYLTNNTTSAGVWKTFQYGAGVSSVNASSLAGTGIIAIGTLLSQSTPVTLFNSNYTAGVNDRAKAYIWNSSGAGVLTLTAPATVADNWFMYFRNAGGGEVVIEVDGAATIDGGANKAFQPGESAIIISDGTNYYTVGFGQSSTFVFDYTVVSVAGGSDYTLSGSELNRIVYKFTGAITANINVIVPATVQQYWIDNSTTGSFTLTVKTSAGTGVAISQGERAILYSDGTNVVDADTASVSYPIAIAQGGTAATTAGSALINLGGTATGISIFTAATQAAAWTALGVAQSGVVNGGSF